MMTGSVDGIVGRPSREIPSRHALPAEPHNDDPQNPQPRPWHRRLRAHWLTTLFRAMRGDLDACFSVAEAVCTGDHFDRPVQRDLALAAVLYRRVARSGDENAQYELGWCYLEGEGVVPDPAQAVRWLGAAAEQGYAEAMRVLADSFRDGLFGIAPDAALATHWQARLDAHLAEHPDDARLDER
jgi:TPR repeat protein